MFYAFYIVMITACVRNGLAQMKLIRFKIWKSHQLAVVLKLRAFFSGIKIPFWNKIFSPSSVTTYLFFSEIAKYWMLFFLVYSALVDTFN